MTRHEAVHVLSGYECVSYDWLNAKMAILLRNEIESAIRYGLDRGWLLPGYHVVSEQRVSKVITMIKDLLSLFAPIRVEHRALQIAEESCYWLFSFLDYMEERLCSKT